MTLKAPDEIAHLTQRDACIDRFACTCTDVETELVPLDPDRRGRRRRPGQGRDPSGAPAAVAHPH
jgi:hypothetical protein